MAKGFDAAAVIGGVGTVMEVTNALIGSEVSATSLPGGTANVISVELGIPNDLKKAYKIACG